MSNLAKTLFFMLASIALLAAVVFIIWATQFKLLIVLPAVFSAAYLAYLAACWTIWK
jgi:hypothetical protein